MNNKANSKDFFHVSQIVRHYFHYGEVFKNKYAADAMDRDRIKAIIRRVIDSKPSQSEVLLINSWCKLRGVNPYSDETGNRV